MSISVSSCVFDVFLWSMGNCTMICDAHVMVRARSCSFQKNNHRMAPMESPMMATLPIVQCNHYHQPVLSDLYQTSIGIHPLYHYHPKPSFLSLLLPTNTTKLVVVGHCSAWQLQVKIYNITVKMLVTNLDVLTAMHHNGQLPQVICL